MFLLFGQTVVGCPAKDLKVSSNVDRCLSIIVDSMSLGQCDIPTSNLNSHPVSTLFAVFALDGLPATPPHPRTAHTVGLFLHFPRAISPRSQGYQRAAFPEDRGHAPKYEGPGWVPPSLPTMIVGVDDATAVVVITRAYRFAVHVFLQQCRGLHHQKQHV